MRSKKLLREKIAYLKVKRKSCKLDFAVLNLLTQDISDAITSSKLKCYEGLANKLNKLKTAPKAIYKNICK